MYFKNDYSEFMHPEIMKHFMQYEGQRFTGYGSDSITETVERTIQNLFSAPEAKAYFLAGGTVSNMTVISSLLRPHEAVISVASGHIEVHETGAIEASGHKILLTKGEDGKILPEEILQVLAENQDLAKPRPKMVYISNATEVGTCYKREELEALFKVCQAENLYLFMDGARLGAALASDESDLCLEEIAIFCDVFYLGGTKIGLPFGEAIVITNPVLQEDFPRLIKNRGAMLAKGFVNAAGFERLLADAVSGESTNNIEDTLFYVLATRANRMAKQLSEVFEDFDIRFAYPPESNQIFVHLDNACKTYLQEREVMFENEEGDLCRFVTTYSTREEEVAAVRSLFETFYSTVKA